MKDRKYLYRHHSRKSREQMASFLLSSSQKLFMTIVLTLLGGSTLILRDLAQGKRYFTENNFTVSLVLVAIATCVFLSAFKAATRLRDYALLIWDDLEKEDGK